MEKPRDLNNRTFEFAVSVIQFLRKLPYSTGNDVIKHQLAKSATSIGANYEEAQGAYSKEDFKYKMSICLREARETNYWLRILNRLSVEDISDLVKESGELMNIFGRIMKTMHFRKDVYKDPPIF